MPFANNAEVRSESAVARVLIYGDHKTKKTWWSLQAAAAGYNVLHLDGDYFGSSIVDAMPLSSEAKARIGIVNLVGNPGSPTFKNFMELVSRDTIAFAWDEQDKCRALVTKPEHTYWEFDFNQLTSDDVLVLDSWSALARNARYAYAMSHALNLADAEKDDWDGYGWEARFMDHVLDTLQRLPCHIIVIAHAKEYEKRDPNSGKIMWAKTIPVSCSGNQGMIMGKDFGAVIHTYRQSSIQIMLQPVGTDSRMGGCRYACIPQKDVRWEDVTPQQIFGSVSGPASGKQSDGFKWIARGAEPKKFAIAGRSSAGISASPMIRASATATPIKLGAK
jgi:hypothetical protein